jgi:hypothetical protein
MGYVSNMALNYEIQMDVGESYISSMAHMVNYLICREKRKTWSRSDVSTKVNHVKSKPSSFTFILPIYSSVHVFSFSLLFSYLLRINTETRKRNITLS